MAASNGLTTLPERSASVEPGLGTKRKRQGTGSESARPSDKMSPAPLSFQATISDVFEVLSSHDTAPAILNFSIDASEDVAHKPSAKRAKTVGDSGPITVSRKVAEAVYSNLDELEEDIHGICAAQIASLKEADEDEDSKQAKRLSGDDVAQMQDIMSFELFVHDVVGREKQLLKPHDEEPKINGVKEESELNGLSNAPDAGRTVLSLYGNAPTGRQLFSSLQEEAGTDVSLQELGLPTMLVATKLLPTPSDASQSQARRTIGDLFAAPASLPQLQPPPKSKGSSNRSTSISFLPSDKFASKSSRKGPYTLQPLTSGKWLRYGNQARRKDRLRDRSNSIVDRPRLEPSTGQTSEQSEEDLFTAAYSSFAPTRDDSRAIISSDTCDLLWWQKIGRRKLHDFYGTGEEASDEMEIEETEGTEAAQAESDNEVQVLQELVDNFDEVDVLENLVSETNMPEEMEAQALLGEITELTRTLSSHQRIRHSSLPQSSLRTPSSPSPLRNILVGTPSEPSEDERAVYRKLQKHLASLISRLPPYLVAKLDGVQVEDLAVNKTFLVEGRTTRGVMEEDQATRAMRGAAAAAASAASKSASQQYGQYGRWPGVNSSSRSSLTPQASQRGSTSYGRSTSGLSSATPIQANRQYSSYSASGTRTSLQPNYGQAAPSNQQYYSRPNYNQPQMSQGSPQPRQGQYATPAQQQYQPQRYSQQMPSYSSYAPATKSSAAPDAYNAQNGGATPAASGYQGSPVKLAATPQTNGTQ